MINLCTCFDKNYLDKGLALYSSLRRHSNDFTLFVCCFDEITQKILNEIAEEDLITVSVEEVEKYTPGLKECKDNRSKAEYCWTCTAPIINYMIHNFDLKECTYIDADLYYYADPAILNNEIYYANGDIAIMEHRFRKRKKTLLNKKDPGIYCVEYNYFNISENAQVALKWWQDECIKWCYFKYEPATENRPYDRYGDQKYLEEFPKRFDNVYVVSHLGGGVAPWNLNQYKLVNNNGSNVALKHTQSGQIVPLVFYHFQNLKYISKTVVNINSQTKDKHLKQAIYYPYLKEIETIRKKLNNKYGIEFQVKKSYSSNPVVAFIQKNIMQYKIGALSDIVRLDKI